MTEDLAARLEARLGAEIRDLRRLTGGASRETWAFQAGDRSLVLRRDPPGAGRPDEMAREAAAIAAAAEAGVPEPPLVDASSDPAVLGSPYLITGFVDGETIARRILREPVYADARARMARELGRVLARLHTIPLDAVPGLASYDPLETLVASYERLGEPLPAVELALHRLRRDRPDPVPDTVVHGDFRNGNLIIAPDGLKAVLDWEIVHRGDPREDLGWLCVKCWRFGAPETVGGFGPLDDLLDGYAEVSGHRPDPDAVRWWQLYGTTRWAIGCRGQAERHLSGQTRSVELAAIGRRVCEQEHDILLLLDVPPTPETARPPAPAPSDLHGRPSVRELVEAVEEFLREEVMPRTDPGLSFHARVAANVLATVGREMDDPAAEAEHRKALDELGVDDRAALADAIRTGRLRPDDPEVLRVVRDEVTARLRVANPRYL